MRVTSILVAPVAVLLLATFALANSVVDLTKTKDFNDIVGKDRPALVEWYAPWCGHCKKLEPVYAEVAASFKDSDNVIIAKVNGDQNKDLTRTFEVKGFPTLKWFPARSVKSEPYTGKRDAASIIEFIKSKTGGANAVKSEATINKATQLTASNFKDIVLDSNKDVLVEFYAPWCGHCKNLAPVYEQVARIFQNDDDCVVAQMNADDEINRPIAEQYGVQSFPTIKFFPRSTDGTPKTPEDYNSGRSQKNFMNFLNSKCGLHRLASGALDDLAGRLPSFDALATQLFETRPTDTDLRTSIVNQAKNVFSKFSEVANTTAGAAANQAATYYIKTMDKILANPGYVEKETTRLSKILEKHTSGVSVLAASKADDIKKRMNVLAAFANKQLSDVLDGHDDGTEEQVKVEHARDEL